MICFYALSENDPYAAQFGTRGAIACDGPASYIVHDGRGCNSTCRAHAVWRKGMSRLEGHGLECPERAGKGPWKQITQSDE